MKRTIPSALLLIAAVFSLAVGASGCGDRAPEPSVRGSHQPATTPLLQKVAVADWCKEHGVPESVCTRCNKSLIPDFQKRGDWCKEHDLPESQCVACHPDLKAKWEAMAPKS